MKKRTLIAIIITIITIIATNQYWLTIRPLPVNFNILGHGKCNIKVQLNEEDNDIFKKVKSKSIQVNLDKQKHVDIFVNRLRFPKRIKITFFDLSSTEPIIIQNIQFRNGKYKLDNIEKFKVDGANVINRDNCLILTPNTDTITLTYSDTLHVRVKTHFDFMVFCIILILTFLLAYKLSNYVAEFSTIKGKSRIEIIFLTIFFTFLFIPMIHMNPEEKSMQENRYLAKWKPLITSSGKINYNFGKGFGKWFNDRFNLRMQFMKCHNFILYKLIHNKKIAKNYYYKNGYMFRGSDFPFYSNDDIKTMSENLTKLNEYLKPRNIDLYILIIPTNSIYDYDKFRILKHKPVTNIDKAVSEIHLNIGTNIFYLEDYFRNLNTKEPIYFKTDGHLTDTTSYFVYKFIIDKLSNKYTRLKLTSEKDFDYTQKEQVRHRADRKFFNGILYDELLVKDKKMLTTQYTFFDYKNSSNIKTTQLDQHIYQYENPNGNYNIMVIGDSFSINICQILKTSFRVLLQFNDNNNHYTDGFKQYYDIIAQNKPDVIFIIYTSNNFERIKYLFNSEKE